MRELKTIAIWIEDAEGGWWRLIATCPQCGKVNYHAGDKTPKPSGGHRIAHCQCHDDYKLVIVDKYKNNKRV
jgi:hypothetical protein